MQQPPNHHPPPMANGRQIYHNCIDFKYERTTLIARYKENKQSNLLFISTITIKSKLPALPLLFIIGPLFLIQLSHKNHFNLIVEKINTNTHISNDNNESFVSTNIIKLKNHISISIQQAAIPHTCPHKYIDNTWTYICTQISFVEK